MISRLNRREKILLSVALVLLLSGTYYLYFYQPLRAEGERLQAELLEVDDAQRLAQSRIEQIPQLEKTLEQMLEEKRKLLGYPVHRPEEILVDIVAAVEGVRLVVTGYQPRLDDEGFSLRFMLEGRYYSMLDLLMILEDLHPRLEIVSFDIRSRSEGLEMDLTLFYHLVEGEG